MEHTEIAPLAKRLAEENNVEWRRLRGSGERGRIVERDVLEYLARVMAGDEALDPTPEPVPEGMQAWPEEDVRAFEHERRAEAVPPVYGTTTVEDEIFLLDGEDDDLGDLDVGEPVGDGGRDPSALAADEDPVELAPSEGAIDDVVDDDLLVAGDDDAAATAAPRWSAADLRAIPDATADQQEGVHDRPFDPIRDSRSGDLLPDLFDDRPDERTWDDGPVFGDTGLGHDEAPADGPTLGAAPAGRQDERDDTRGGPWLDGGELGGGGSSTGPTADAGTGGRTLDLDAPDSGALEPGTPGAGASDEDALDADAVDAGGLDTGGLDDAALDLGEIDEAPDDAGPRAGGRHDGRPDAATPQAPALGDPTPAPAPAAATTVGAAPAVPRATGDTLERLPLVRHGAVFRRQVDLSNLVAAQADVARQLGFDEPVPAIAFLARAAAKALDDGSNVAVAVLEEHAVRTVTLDVASRSFADVVTAFAGVAGAADEGDGGPDLIVADLSDLELDEAVLHLAAPVLAIGRVLVDTSTGGRRATLTLSGDATGRDAGRILARAAELLETPIRIVL